MIEKAWDIRIEGKLNRNNFIFQEKYYKFYEVLKEEDNKIRKNRAKITSNIRQKRQK